VATAFSRDEQITKSRDVAVLSHYLGLPLIRVELSADNKSETYTVKCKQFDFEQIVQEAASDDTTVCYASLQKSNGFIGSKIGYARKNGGVWSSFSKPMEPQRTTRK